MKDGFKQRLTGAMVLLVIALILWSVIFTDSDNMVMDRTSQIPPTPAFKEYRVAKPVRPQKIKPVAQQPAAKGQAKVKQSPRQDKTGLPEAWVLQVASFTQSEKADQLKQALQKEGYKAFTRVAATKEAKLKQVFVGPRFTKDAFNSDKKTIDKRFKVESMIVRFNSKR